MSRFSRAAVGQPGAQYQPTLGILGTKFCRGERKSVAPPGTGQPILGRTSCLGVFVVETGGLTGTAVVRDSHRVFSPQRHRDTKFRSERSGAYACFPPGKIRGGAGRRRPEPTRFMSLAPADPGAIGRKRIGYSSKSARTVEASGCSFGSGSAGSGYRVQMETGFLRLAMAGPDPGIAPTGGVRGDPRITSGDDNEGAGMTMKGWVSGRGLLRRRRYPDAYGGVFRPSGPCRSCAGGRNSPRLRARSPGHDGEGTTPKTVKTLGFAVDSRLRRVSRGWRAFARHDEGGVSS
jgi:hypothetical protein